MRISVELDDVTSGALLAWSDAEDRPAPNAAQIAIKAFLKAQGLDVGDLPLRYVVVQEAD